MTENNQYYRYCFECDKWKKKEEINEIDWGNSNISYNCDVCRKDLGNQIQIFRCPNHPEEILKIWGTLENENKEKVFYEKCPQEQQIQEPNFWDKIPTFLKIGGIIAIPLGFMIAVLIWWNKTSKQIVKDKFKPLHDIIDKKTKSDEKSNQKDETGLETDSKN
jgi:nitrogen fixation-related uncharacterized protein